MGMKDWVWKWCCYTAPWDELRPFGFCDGCWIKHGRPKSMEEE